LPDRPRCRGRVAVDRRRAADPTDGRRWRPPVRFVERVRARAPPRREGAGPVQIVGSVALVTGGASGLGLATVKRLHDAGAGVVILDLPSSNGTTVAKELGARAAFAAGDVTSPDDVTAALDAAQALADGPPRILVKCA